MNNFWTLVKYEASKFINRKLVLIFCLACIIFVAAIIISNINHGCPYFKDENTGGLSSVSKEIDVVSQNKGYITYDLLKKAVQSDRELISDENNFITENGNKCETIDAYIKYIMPYENIIYMLNVIYCTDIDSFSTDGLRLYPTIDYNKIADISDKELSEFNERYINFDKDFQSEINNNGPDKITSDKLVDSISVPFYNDYFTGYEEYFTKVQGLSIFIILTVLIVTAPIFSFEYERKSDSILLASKNGKTSLCFAKIFVSASFAIIFSFVILFGMWLSVMAIHGFKGGNVNIQLLDASNIYPITLFRASMIHIVSVVITCLLLSSFIALLSSRVKASTLPVIGIGMAVVILPMFTSISYKNTPLLFRIKMFLPAFSTAFPFGNYFYYIFGQAFIPYKFIWTVSIILTIVFYFLAGYSFKKHQVM